MASMPIEEIILTAERVARIVLTALAAYFVALWIAAIWWTFRDIRSRTNDFLLQLAATLLVPDAPQAPVHAVRAAAPVALAKLPLLWPVVRADAGRGRPARQRQRRCGS